MSIIDGSPGLSVSVSASSPPSFPLDFMSVMPIAAWWTRKLFSGNVADDISALRVSDSASQNIPFAPNGVIDVANLAAFSTINNSRLDVWYDQVPPGANLNLSGGFFNQGPLIYSGTTGIELDGNIPVANFNGDSLGRNDSLGFVGDPAMSIGWVMRNLQAIGLTDFPTLLTFGATGDFDIYFSRDGVNDIIVFSGPITGLDWFLPLNFLDGNHRYLVTKTVGSNWGPVGWNLLIDGVNQGPGTLFGANPMTITNDQTMLGDFAGGGFPFIGKCPGMVIYNTTLVGNDVTVLDSFLQSQQS